MGKLFGLGTRQRSTLAKAGPVRRAPPPLKPAATNQKPTTRKPVQKSKAAAVPRVSRQGAGRNLDQAPMSIHYRTRARAAEAAVLRRSPRTRNRAVAVQGPVITTKKRARRRAGSSRVTSASSASTADTRALGGNLTDGQTMSKRGRRAHSARAPSAPTDVPRGADRNVGQGQSTNRRVKRTQDAEAATVRNTKAPEVDIRGREHNIDQAQGPSGANLFNTASALASLAENPGQGWCCYLLDDLCENVQSLTQRLGRLNGRRGQRSMPASERGIYLPVVLANLQAGNEIRAKYKNARRLTLQTASSSVNIRLNK